MQPDTPVQNYNQNQESMGVATPPQSPIPNVVSTPQPIITPAAPSPMNPAATAEFTSNPFLAFGKGLGAGLYRSPGAVIGLSAWYFLSILIMFVGGGLITAIVASFFPIIGILMMFLLFFAMIFILSVISGRGAIALYESQVGHSLNIKETGDKFPAKYAINVIVCSLLYGLGVGFGLLFFIVPGLILMARWGLGIFVIADEKVGPIQAIKRSWALTKGNTWNMLGATIVQNIILGQSLLLVGMYSATANRYFELKNLELKGVRNTITHWSNYVLAVIMPLFLVLYSALIITAVVLEVNKTSDTTTTTGDVEATLPEDYYSSGYSMEYCFFDGDFMTDPTVEQKCVQTEEECQANTYCKELYGSGVEDAQ